MNDIVDGQRRAILHLAAGLTAATLPGMSDAGAATASRAAGKPGDFDFLSGNWTIRHRRLAEGSWDQFDGEASVVGILGGVASVEELRIPSRGFHGMGLRILDTSTRLWADYWCNGKDGALQAPSWGGFSGGAGTWDAVDGDGPGRTITRGVWDSITPRSCRWRQAVSRDGGATWEENWVMDWQRTPKS